MPEIIDYIKKLRESAKKRNFTQTFDLIINLKDFDIKKPIKGNEPLLKVIGLIFISYFHMHTPEEIKIGQGLVVSE